MTTGCLYMSAFVPEFGHDYKQLTGQLAGSGIGHTSAENVYVVKPPVIDAA